MSEDMLTWLHSQIVAEKEAAEAAAADMPPGGDAWVASEAEYNSAGADVVDTQNRGVAVGRAGEGATSMPIAVHMALHDPRDTIARCEADLAILDEHEIYDSRYGPSCMVCFEEGKGGDDVPAEAPCRTVRLLAYGRRHRPGWHPDWAPEGMTP